MERPSVSASAEAEAVGDLKSRLSLDAGSTAFSGGFCRGVGAVRCRGGGIFDAEVLAHMSPRRAAAH